MTTILACEQMTDAIVMDGGRRGELVRVCADPSCRAHHPDIPSGEQVAKQRAEERKQIEKKQTGIATRHYDNFFPSALFLPMCCNRATLSEKLFPEGAINKAGWRTKALQLDLEAKGIVVR